jgi:hypothetical protein
MHQLLAELTNRIISGVERKSATTCSRHAELYRKFQVGEQIVPLNHLEHPWTREMRDHRGNWNSPKGAQLGITEVGLDVALYNIDILKQSVIYFLPKRNPDAADFSKDRFGTAIELSPHYQVLFSDINNVGHKKAGIASLYIRGTRSKSATKSIPAPTVILDEYDEMVQANVRQAIERTSGKKIKQIIRYSTPTIPDFGIDLVHKSSTQDHYFFRCPSCSRLIELIFPDDLIVTADSTLDITNLKKSYYRCNQCHATLPHESKIEYLDYRKSEWASTTNHDSDERGFYINQFYSMQVTPYEMAKTYLESIDDPARDQEWWNSKGGIAYVPKGSRVTIKEVSDLIGSHSSTNPIPSGLITMGVDQGKKIYYEIDQWFLPSDLGNDLGAKAHCKVLKAGYLTEFESLDRLMRDYQVNHCVCDYQPERRKAEEFMKRFYGYVKLCYYGRSHNTRSFNVNETEQSITVHRTSWLDAALSRFKKKTISLPLDLPADYARHVNNLIRRYDSDSDNNPIAYYVNVGADHFGHARTYSEMALILAVSQETNRNLDIYL